MASDGYPADEEDANTSDDDSFDGFLDPSSSEDLPDWGGSELETAYLKAMSALEASDSVMPAEPVVELAAQIDSRDHETEVPDEPALRSSATSPALNQSQPASATETSRIAVELISNQRPADPTKANSSNAAPAERPPTPQQIIEACLFVGGTALTASRLAAVLRGEFPAEFVDRAIDELNRSYAAENRPYEIRLGEGGYRLALRDEYERIRHKVYGLGPKEVRLSQDALEVLAVVAYHQPIKQSRVEELGKPGCGAVLKQLVRRELLAIERDPEHPRDVNYKTTPRFLSLFGIQNLDDLPRHEQVSYK